MRGVFCWSRRWNMWERCCVEGVTCGMLPGSHLSAKLLTSATTEFPNHGQIPSAKKNNYAPPPQEKQSALVFSLRNSSRQWKQMRLHEISAYARLARRHFWLFLPCGEHLNIFLLILVQPKEMSRVDIVAHGAARAKNIEPYKTCAKKWSWSWLDRNP